MTSHELECALLAAHADGCDADLATLYEAAADQAGLSNDQRAFYLTQAYVFALSAGVPRAKQLNARLVALGRDQDASNHL